MAEVPVLVLGHLTKAQRKALAIADNRLPLNAGWDEEMLRLELAELRDDEFNLDVLGFSDDELADLFAGSGDPIEGLTDEDAAPEPPEVAITRTGRGLLAKLQSPT
jgi:ParB-like chromosome segregation protein Spo0J